MKNQQRPTPRLTTDGSRLFVHSIFPTIQGEGPYAGRPAIFVRLTGCNLQCPACDTEYSSDAPDVDVFDLVDRIEAYIITTGDNLVVITGGEPFRQNIYTLCEELIRRQVDVQIETNGMLQPQGFNARTIYELQKRGQLLFVVSPKTHKLDGFIAEHASAFKYVVTAGQVHPDGFPLLALGHPLPTGAALARPPVGWRGVIYIQPADTSPTENPAHLAAALASVETLTRTRAGDFRIGLQTHKLMGLA